MLLLETALILGQEPVEVMKEHPVERRAFGMSRTVHSRHSGRMASRNGPKLGIRWRLPEKRGKAQIQKPESRRKRINQR
jgi:hypothetical protein